MSFIEPGCAATASSTTTNSSNPLHLARSLFTDMTSPITISTFTKHLAAIHDAAYLLLLPKTCPAELEFHHAETARISTGPSGAAVLRASSLFFLNTFRQDAIDDERLARSRTEDAYEATGRMLWDLAAEEGRYLGDMALLLADMKAKWKEEWIETGSWHKTALKMGESGIASARALSDLVGHLPYHHHNNNNDKRYLSAIARYWRTWGMESKAYEEVWVYVAGRPLVQE